MVLLHCRSHQSTPRIHSNEVNYHTEHIRAYHQKMIGVFHPSCSGGWTEYQHHVWMLNLNYILTGGLVANRLTLSTSNEDTTHLPK